MKKRARWTACLIPLLLLTSCSFYKPERSAEELLALAVSGLSGVDRYTFDGETTLLLANGRSARTAKFEGEIRNHRNLSVHVQGSQDVQTGQWMQIDRKGPDRWIARDGMKEAEEGADWNAVQTLERLVGAPKNVAYLPRRPENRAWIVKADLEAAHATRDWKRRLEREFESAVQAARTSIAKLPVSRNDDFRREWNAEIAGARKELERMMKGLNVQSTYIVAIDRRRMLPLEITELTTLQYERDGQTCRESRTTNVTFGL